MIDPTFTETRTWLSTILTMALDVRYTEHETSGFMRNLRDAVDGGLPVDEWFDATFGPQEGVLSSSEMEEPAERFSVVTAHTKSNECRREFVLFGLTPAGVTILKPWVDNGGYRYLWSDLVDPAPWEGSSDG